MIERFRVVIGDDVLDDLRKRLHATRYPGGVTIDGGIPLDEVRELIHYWADDFDWARRADELNRWDHYRTEIGGLRVHYIHARCGKPHARALLLLHGWPGSFVEMTTVLPLLATTFDVVVPSLPGFGFSDPAITAGMSNERIARMMVALMDQLGYDRFVVQGGDWGAGIASWMALRYPEKIIGMHLNYIPGSYSPSLVNDKSSEEQSFITNRDTWSERSGAYGHVQRTRPLTLGYGLGDSPAGLAAWIIEKFREWSDPACHIPVDTLLVNVTIYWATNSIATSMRLYLESVRTPLLLARGQRFDVPCAIAHFPLEAPFPPRSWVERGYNVTRWTDMPHGGHFAALEAPTHLARDVTEFAAAL